MTGQNKVIDDIVQDDGLHMLEGIQHATEKEQKVFQNIICVYDAAS